jgi:hypothetical protein
LLSGPETAEDMAEVVTGSRAERPSGPSVDVHALDGRKHLPTEPGIDALVVGKVPTDHSGGVPPEFGEVVGLEGRGGADDVPAESDVGGAIHGQTMGTDHVLEVDPAGEELVAEDSDQGLTEVAGTAGDDNVHDHIRSSNRGRRCLGEPGPTRNVLPITNS